MNAADTSATGKRRGDPLSPEEVKKLRREKTARIAGGKERAARVRLFAHECVIENVRPYKKGDYPAYRYSPDGSDNEAQYCDLIVQFPPMSVFYGHDSCFPGYNYNDKDKRGELLPLAQRKWDKRDATVTLIKGKLPSAIANTSVQEANQAKALKFISDLKKLHVQYIFDNPDDFAAVFDDADKKARDGLTSEEKAAAREKAIAALEAKDVKSPKEFQIEAEERVILADAIKKEISREINTPLGSEKDDNGAEHPTIGMKSGLVWDSRGSKADEEIPAEITAEAMKKNAIAIKALELYQEGKVIRRPKHTIWKGKEPTSILKPCMTQGDVVVMIGKVQTYNHGKHGINIYWLDNGVTVVKSTSDAAEITAEVDGLMVEGFDNMDHSDFNKLSDKYKLAYFIINNTYEKDADKEADGCIPRARAIDFLDANGFERAVADEIIDELCLDSAFGLSESDGKLKPETLIPGTYNPGVDIKAPGGDGTVDVEGIVADN